VLSRAWIRRRRVWLRAEIRRGDKEPSLADLAVVTTPVHAVTTVTGSSTKSLDTAAAALGPAAANWNSRLLIAINHAAIQDIVYTSQGKFRNKIKHYRVPNQPAATYLLRNYLRLCLPKTIEASINKTISLVEHGSGPAVQNNPASDNTVPQHRPSAGRGSSVLRSKFLPDDSSAVLEKYLDPDGAGMQPDRIRATTPFLTKNGLRVRDLPRFLNGAEFAARRRDLVKELLAQGQKL